MMPDVGRLGVPRAAQEHPVAASVPVVIISILRRSHKGFALGAAAVMQSPVSRQELYDTLVMLGLSPYRRSRIRVLVVDDDPKAVELVAVRIGGMASEISERSGARGHRDRTRELPDLIVLDLMMPDVNGFDVVEGAQHASRRPPRFRWSSSRRRRSPPRSERGSTASSPP
jgi:PleD family two-component response regulator